MAQQLSCFVGPSNFSKAHEFELGLKRLIHEAATVPIWEYVTLSAVVLAVFFYRMFDLHLVEDILTGMRGDTVHLVHSPFSKFAAELLAKSEVLKQRYWPTPWLCSPHLQTGLLHFFGRPPAFEYSRELFVAPDGGTVALDWSYPFTSQDTKLEGRQHVDGTPIVIIIPGLSSCSASSYIKHLAWGISKKGWSAVVANHRGHGGVSISSDKYYNAGWTNDLRWIIASFEEQYNNSPLLAVGTSIGANILVKYLGEEGESTPLVGCFAFCCPWDLLICERFINRTIVHKLYDKAIAIGLKGFVKEHKNTISKLPNWHTIKRSNSRRDLDDHFTRTVGNFETLDAYYRRCSSVHFLGGVAVPLVCINSKDDPLCAKESIPWDECRINSNVLLGVTKHGGHLAYFEGMTAKSLWWIRCLTECFEVILSLRSQEKVFEQK